MGRFVQDGNEVWRESEEKGGPEEFIEGKKSVSRAGEYGMSVIGPFVSHTLNFACCGRHGKACKHSH